MNGVTDADGAAQYRPRPVTDSEIGESDDGVSNIDSDDVVATPDMCHYCFDTLLKELLPELALDATHGRRRSPKRRHTKKKSNDDSNFDDRCINDIDELRERLESQLTYNPPSVDCPLFVTWSKLRSPNHPPLLSEVSTSGISSGITTPASERGSSNITDDEISTYDDSDYDLRGCIGTLSPKPLNYACECPTIFIFMLESASSSAAHTYFSFSLSSQYLNLQ